MPAIPVVSVSPKSLTFPLTDPGNKKAHQLDLTVSVPTEVDLTLSGPAAYAFMAHIYRIDSVDIFQVKTGNWKWTDTPTDLGTSALVNPPEGPRFINGDAGEQKSPSQSSEYMPSPRMGLTTQTYKFAGQRANMSSLFPAKVALCRLSF